MRVAIVSGIYPPDIGGPATHAVDLKAELAARGHDPTVVTLTDSPKPGHARGMVRFPRRWPWPLRFAAVVGWLVLHRWRFDVVYATGMQTEAVIGGRLGRLPVVVKFVGDPAWERGMRLGLVNSDFDEFQTAPPRHWRVRSMRWLRSITAGSADRVVVPSDYLADAVARWTRDRVRPQVVRNGVRVPDRLTPFDGIDAAARLRVLVVGRLVPWKNVPMIIDAVADMQEVQLTIVGDGPEEDTVTDAIARAGLGSRVEWLGRASHDEVLGRLSGADILLSLSTYEGLPHTVIEALAVGTPAVTTSAGGTTEAVVDEVNGLVLEEADRVYVRKALRRLLEEEGLLERITDGARRSGEDWRFEVTVERLLGILGAVASEGRRANRPRSRLSLRRSRDAARQAPRIVFLGKVAGLAAPSSDVRKKVRILASQADVTLVAPGSRSGDLEGARVVSLPTTNAVPGFGTLLHYLLSPIVGLLFAVGRRPSAIVCQSPYEAVLTLPLARLVPPSLRPGIVVEIHGDWRTASRLSGSRVRRLVTPLADRMADAVVRSADRVRAVSDYTRRLVETVGYQGDFDQHVAFSDYERFRDAEVKPLPEQRQVAFVGVLQRYKAPDVLVASWSSVHRRFRDARLVIVGDGPMRGRLERAVDRAGLTESIEFRGRVSRDTVADVLDDSWLLVLPSRSEGLGLVILEAMARSRAVVGSRVGGIPQLVADGLTGLLVSPEDPKALADALTRALADRHHTERMGARGRKAFEALDPEREFATGVEELAGWVARAPWRKP